MKDFAKAITAIVIIFAIGLGSYFLLGAYIAADWWWVQHSLDWSYPGAGLVRFFVAFGAAFALLLSISAACAATDQL